MHAITTFFDQRSKSNNYNLSLLVEIIDQLKQKDTIRNIGKISSYSSLKSSHKLDAKSSSNSKFYVHFVSAEELLKYLNGSNLIDFRYENGRYVLCSIIEKDLFEATNAPQKVTHSNIRDYFTNTNS